MGFFSLAGQSQEKSRSEYNLTASSLHVSVKSSVGHVEVAHVCFDAEAPGAPKRHIIPLGANLGLDVQYSPAQGRVYDSCFGLQLN